jgi:hypothetical protein
MPSQPNRSKQTGISRVSTLIILVLWLLVVGGLVANRQNLYDWWQLRNYEPSTVVSQIASQTAMNDYGRKIFYVNHPAIVDKVDFQAACPEADTEHTIVLGCYHGGQAGIFLFDVTDERLNGVEQVTAAHEMLHGAYDRLSSKERARVNAMLQKYYNEELHDERILKTIDAYKKTEPTEIVNEMHSIFATEIRNLPTELEAYYKRYFSDRSQVALLAEQYQQEFTSRQQAVVSADARLSQLKNEIDGLQAELKTRQTQIETQQANLVALRKEGNITAYNAGVAPYNALIATYNNGVARLQSLISDYNKLVASRNAIALEQEQLVKNLSSDSAPIHN